jgi:hypothetical protein
MNQFIYSIRIAFLKQCISLQITAVKLPVTVMLTWCAPILIYLDVIKYVRASQLRAICLELLGSGMVKQELITSTWCFYFDQTVFFVLTPSFMRKWVASISLLFWNHAQLVYNAPSPEHACPPLPISGHRLGLPCGPDSGPQLSTPGPAIGRSTPRCSPCLPGLAACTPGPPHLARSASTSAPLSRCQYPRGTPPLFPPLRLPLSAFPPAGVDPVFASPCDKNWERQTPCFSWQRFLRQRILMPSSCLKNRWQEKLNQTPA